uniref:Uncharacterized protein n=1 Tax=Oryza punctata TaxID=4537 RepID=A0A0E0MKH5_ORYPU
MPVPDPHLEPVFTCIGELVEQRLYTNRHDTTRTQPVDLDEESVKLMVTASLRNGVDAVIDLLEGVFWLCVDPNRVAIQSALLDAVGIATPASGPPIRDAATAAADA